MEYRVLGPISASHGGEWVALGGPRQRLVLAVLLVEAGRPLSADRLVDGVWGDNPPERARHTLQAYISELRKVLDDRILWTGSGYLLETERDNIDARRFGRLASEGHDLFEKSPERAATTLREALELWHGEPYADLADSEALQSEIRRLQQLRLVAVEDRIEADLALGRHRSVVEELDAVTREHPFRERLHAQLMLALYRSGRQAEALRAYQAARQVLAEELGIEPSAELAELEQRILDQDPTLDVSPATPAVAGSVSWAKVDNGERPFAIHGFELRELVGEGHLGRVFRAYQPAMGREVALKVIRPELANDAAFIRSFESEARVLAGLEHPHLVPLYDYWRDPTGTCLVSPWMAGGSLSAALRLGPLSLAAAMRMIDQVSSCLSYAHRQGALHRNIRPSNVLFDLDGNAYLTDLRIGFPATAPVPPHAAPEERLGVAVTPAADVYQFGLLIRRSLSVDGSSEDGPSPNRTRLRSDLPVEIERVLARATATEPYDRFRSVDLLVRELHRATGSDVVALSSAQDDESVTERNPYKGLRAFEETDAEDFFGREDLIGTLVEAVTDHRLVAVVGPSGTGKSSLVRAGLIPALRSGAVAGSDRWLITDMHPATYPFEELVDALDRVAITPVDTLADELTGDEGGISRVVKRVLPDDEAELLLIIDQFEELFSLVTDHETRRLFLDGMATAVNDPASRLRVVATLRADFFDRPLQYHRFGELLRSGLIAVSTLSPDGLARAVSGPARNVGVELEPGLAAEIVRDFERQPGSLPLLQHSLAEIFDRRQGRLLTIDSYRDTGGVAKALGRRSEELYQSLNPVEQQAVQHIFLRLVTVAETREDTRRRVRRSELAALGAETATIDTVLQLFGSYRLLTFDRDPVSRNGTVEVAHEALLHEWERLRAWIDARRADLLLHVRLEAAVREWAEAGRNESFLLNGGRLEQFEQWGSQTDLTLTSLEREYLASSRAFEDAAHTRRRRTRHRVMAALLAIAVVASVLALAATIQQRRAERGERAAQVRGLTEAVRVNLDQDPDLALLLAIKAAELASHATEEENWAATATLHEVLLATPRVVAVEGREEVAWSPDGGRIVTLGKADGDQNAYVWDASTGDEIASLPGEHSPNRVAWQGDRIVVTYSDAPAAVWDAESYRLVGTLGDHPNGYTFAVMTPDGTMVALSELPPGGGRPTAVSVWEVETGENLLHLEFPAGTWSTAISFDGLELAVAETETGQVRRFDLASGEETLTLDHGGHVDWVAYSPDGLQAVTGGDVVKLWDLSDGVTGSEMPVPGDALGPLRWDPTGSLLAGVGLGEVAYLVGTDSDSETPELPLRGHQWLNGLAFSPDGQRLATTGDGTRIWDLNALSGGELMTYQSSVRQSVTQAAWTPDARRAVTTSFDNGATTVFDTASGRVLATFPNQAAWGITARALPSPDGRYIAMTGETRDLPTGPVGTTVILDANTLEEVVVLDPGGNPGAFTTDSSLLMVGNFSVAHVYEVESWELVTTLSDEDSRTEGFYAFWDGHFLADGRHLLTGDTGRRPGGAIWDMANWSIVATLPVGEGFRPYSISGGPEGGLLVLGSFETGVVSVYEEEEIIEALPEPASPLIEIALAEPPIFVSLSPDESILITGGFDNRLSLWQLPTGEPMYSVNMDMAVSGAAFTADGRHILVPLEQGLTHLLTLEPEELIELASQRALRDLTAGECRRYLNRDTCPTP